jgi:hypothetical protein
VREGVPRALALVLGISLVMSSVVSAVSPAWATSDQATSVNVGNEAFLAGKFVEAGVRANGAFGSNAAAPAGFHPQGVSGVGFVAIRDTGQPSWSAASAAGLVDGDFFLPGSPYEGWGMRVGSTQAFNNHSATAIAGTLGSVTNVTGDSGNNTVGWSSTAPFEGVAIQKTYSVPQSGQRLDISVTLTNSTGAPITDIYYGRGVDPDDGNSCSTDCFTSTNTIESQMSEGSAFSRVSANFTRGSQINLFSQDPRARVARESGGFSSNFNIVDVWNGTGNFIGTVGSTAVGDAGINLALKVDSLGAGESTTLTFSYLLTAGAAEAATGDAPVGDAPGEPASAPGVTPRIGLDFRASPGRPAEGIPVDIIGLDLPEGAKAIVSLYSPENRLFDATTTRPNLAETIFLPGGLAAGTYTLVYRVILPGGEILALHRVFEVSAEGVVIAIGDNVVGLGPAAAPVVAARLAYTGVQSNVLPWWALGLFTFGLLLVLYSVRALRMVEQMANTAEPSPEKTPWEILATPIRVPGIDYVPGTSAGDSGAQSLPEAIHDLDIALSRLIASRLSWVSPRYSHLSSL